MESGVSEEDVGGSIDKTARRDTVIKVTRRPFHWIQMARWKVQWEIFNLPDNNLQKNNGRHIL
jgi:hypothetical protein